MICDDDDDNWQGGGCDDSNDSNDGKHGSQSEPVCYGGYYCNCNDKWR